MLFVQLSNRDRGRQMSDSSKALRRIITGYCADFPKQIEALRTNLKTGLSHSDYVGDLGRSIHSEVHRMAGAAQCMGFRRVAIALQKTEHDLEPLLNGSERVLKRFLSTLDTRFADIEAMKIIVTPAQSRVLKRATSLESDLPSDNDNDYAATARHRIMSRERILFADDDMHTRELMRATLMELGVEDVCVVSSGLDVLNEIELFDPTMIITDWCMEPISGLELLQCIRRGGTPLKKDIPVIFYTSQKGRERIGEASKHGVSHLLAKPVSPSAIQEAVLSVLEKQFVARNRLSVV